MYYFLFIILFSINPFIELADIENSKGETIDSYYENNDSVHSDKMNSWVKREFLKDAVYFKELERKLQEIYGDEDERCVVYNGEKFLAELELKRPVFSRYLASIKVYVNTKE